MPLSVTDIATTAVAVGGSFWAVFNTMLTLNIRNSINELKIEMIVKLSDLTSAQAVQSSEISNLEKRLERLEGN